MRRMLQGISEVSASTLAWNIGILSYEMEAELERESMFDILDNRIKKKKGAKARWFIFNMGGSDARLFSRDFCLEFALRGGKYATKEDYLTEGPFEKQAFIEAIHQQLASGQGYSENYIVFAGFFGYLFSMILCHDLWECIVKGDMIPMAGFKQLLEEMLEEVQKVKVKIGTGTEKQVRKVILDFVSDVQSDTWF
jgi:hypothetical protein